MDSLIPVEYSITAPSINEAKRIFKQATHRLLSIGEWNRICNGLSRMFRLADHSGRIISRKARAKDLFRIDDQNTLEVSRLVTYKKPSGKSESMAIELRGNEGEGEELFEIKRYNNVVTAIIHEPTRPEVSQKLAYISPLEWSSLVKRLLADGTD
jgi:hypothetical protein